MIDIKLIRQNPDAVKQLIIDKRSKHTDVDRVLELDAQRRDLQTQIDGLKSDQKKAGNTPDGIVKAKELKLKIQELQEQYDANFEGNAELAEGRTPRRREGDVIADTAR